MPMCIAARIDDEVIDKSCFTRGARNLCQLTLGKHIDQRRFADVASTDECKLVEVVIGDLLQFLATALKLGFADNHRGREISMTKIQFFCPKVKRDTPYY